MTFDLEREKKKTAILAAILLLEGNCRHGNPTYYDICRHLGIGRYERIRVSEVVDILHELEKKGDIAGEGGYWCKGTHSGAGAKKWHVVEPKPIYRTGLDRWIE